MIKENLYCVPFEKRVLRNSKGISYHCERNGSVKKEDSNNYVKDKNVQDKKEQCNVCKKEFKDTRALKIHKTKTNHHTPMRTPTPASKTTASKTTASKTTASKTTASKTTASKTTESKTTASKTTASKKQNQKRNRSYSLSPYEKRVNKATIK